MIQVPSGEIGNAAFAKANTPITGNRQQRFTFELLDLDGAPKGALSTVTGGRL